MRAGNLMSLLGFMLLCFPCQAAIWKAGGKVGLTGIQAEMNDGNTPAAVMIRVENFSKLAPVTVSRYFIQMTDGQKTPLRSIPPDELVSGRLERLRQILPQYVHEINQMLGEIKADYPQEKLIAVYAQLREFMAHGRPQDWRSGLQNWLEGVRGSTTPAEIAEANRLIEEIGDLARNYLWPRDVAPNAVYNGLVFFDVPVHGPPFIYFQMGQEFIGWPMVMEAGGPQKKKRAP